MGKAFEKQKQLKIKSRKINYALKYLKTKEQTKAITYKSDDDNDKTSTSKEIYDEILEEWIAEIIKMSKEISHGDLGYDFKGPTASINFGKYGGPMYIYGHMKMVKKHYK